MKKQIPESTRQAILDATWKLLEEKGRADLSQAEIAAAAGVSRQTLFLAFGNRTGLLTAMVRNKDLQSRHVAEMTTIAQADELRPADLERYLEIWLEYLPVIYPVGILLDAAAVTDREAAEVWDDRMKHALLAGIQRILRRLGQNGHLRPGTDPSEAADLIWSLVHPAAWRLLVAERGWAPARFAETRMEMIRSLVLAA